MRTSVEMIEYTKQFVRSSSIGGDSCNTLLI